MAISTGIPSSRVPMIAIRMDPSRAAASTGDKPKTLVHAQFLAAGAAVKDVPVMVTSDSESERLAGVGSVADMMLKAARLNDPLGEIWLLPVEDNSGGTAAQWTITVTCSSAKAGTLRLYIGAEYVDIAVTKDMAQNDLADAIYAAINAADYLPITAASPGANVVTVTFRHKGTVGNGLKIVANYYGASANEFLPSGVTCVVASTVSGATDPDITAGITALGDDEYDCILTQFNDSTNLAEIVTELERRWGSTVMVDSLAWTAIADSAADLVTFGTTNVNCPYLTVAGYEEANNTPPWVWGAAYGSAVHAALKDDPARPCQTIQLIGCLPTLRGSRFTLSERDSLLNAGIATSLSLPTSVRIEREITTYQTNEAGAADVSMLDVQTLATNRLLNRELTDHFQTRFPRHKLADDIEDAAGLPANTMTPGLARIEICGLYDGWADRGLVENADTFAATLEVERDGTDPNRLLCLFPPDVVNQFRQFYVVNQFRLQY